MKYSTETYLDSIFGNDGSLGSAQFFDWPESAKSYDPKQDLHSYIEDDPEFVLDVLHQGFTDFKSLLKGYSVYQKSNGLDYIMNVALSNYVHVIWDCRLNKQSRIEIIRSLPDFILHVFEDTAEPILCHLDQAVQNRRNYHHNMVCYMLWDTSVIPYGRNFKDTQDMKLYISVLERCVQSSNVAVVEGALHGLGHAYFTDMESEELKSIIESAVDKANFGIGPNAEALRHYAKYARIGMVQ